MPEDEERPEITDKIPAAFKEEYDRLKAELDRVIPAKKTDSNILIATWNIKEFGSFRDEWVTKTGDTPKRNVRSLKYITEIVSRFDVVAIQEVTGNLRGLRHMLEALGPDWSLMMSDEVRGTRGNKERFAYVFDTRRVKLSGLAGELVIPTETMTKVVEEEGEKKKKKLEFPIEKQFARTPYAVGFKTLNKTFVLVTFHIIFGKESDNVKQVKERAKELLVIAEWLADWATRINKWEHNLIVLGDFNIDREGDKLYEAFVGGGLDIHPHFHNLPRTVHDLDNPPDKKKYYDQIAWFMDNDDKPALSMRFMKGGYFQFWPCVFDNLTESEVEWRMSDHFPLWAEFEVDPEEEEVIPTLPVPSQADIDRKKADRDAWIRVAQTLTELENAYILYMADAAGSGWTVERKADEYLMQWVYKKQIVEKFAEMLKSSKDNLSIPCDNAKELLSVTKSILEAKPDEDKKTLVTLNDLKTSIRQMNKWPFLRRWCR